MRNTRRGSTLVEAALLIPLIVLLLVGMVTVARITYLYYTLRKTVYSVARYVGTQQGVNFCDSTDATLANAIEFGLTGTTDDSQPVFVTGLTPAMVIITAQQYDPITGALSDFCASGQGTAPDFVAVSIQGYTIPVRLPGLQIDPIQLNPKVQVPYGGT
jgi:hypothetical protein